MKRLFALLGLSALVLVFAVGCEKRSSSSSTESLELNRETAFVMVKPNAIEENHIGAIIERFEGVELKVAALKFVQPSKVCIEKFYEEHKGKSFYPEVVARFSSNPVVAIVLEGDNAVAKARKAIGATDPAKADPGTIRADFGKSIGENAVHGSDAKASAKREIALFFTPCELYERFPKVEQEEKQ